MVFDKENSLFDEGIHLKILDRNVSVSKTFHSFLLLAREAAARRCSSKYVLLRVSQYSQENTCVGVSV